jgi:hypothetical protein|tara:strand:+ start:10880 stop:11152 length:273 start_codon:yes stop_codon:yes gene_type:complete
LIYILIDIFVSFGSASVLLFKLSGRIRFDRYKLKIDGMRGYIELKGVKIPYHMEHKVLQWNLTIKSAQESLYKPYGWLTISRKWKSIELF